MTVNQKPSGRAVSMPRGLLIGGLTSLGITLAVTALLAKLMEREAIPDGKIGYWVMGMLLLAAVSGSAAAAGKIKRRRLMVSLLSGGVYFLTLMGITALFFGGQYEAVGVTAILVAGGSLLPVLCRPSPNRGGKKKRPGVRNR